MRSCLARLAACLAVLALSGPASAGFFVMPTDGQLFARPMGGSAGAVTEFGLALSPTNLAPALFTGLPNNPNPNTELLVGTFAAGQTVDFWMRSTFGSTVQVTSFDTTSTPARVAFLDINNSLGMNGSVIQQTSATTWLLRLDDAISFQFDDDDNDVLIQLRLQPGVTAVPEPTSLALCGTGAIALAGYALRRRKRAG